MSRLRIRTLKPDCWADEAISPLSREARLLFVVLITFCDDDGRCRYMPSQIIGHGYLEDEDVAGADLERWMSELEAAGVFIRYEVKGKRYGTFPNWHKHQRINRHTASTLPPCPRRAGVTIWPRKTHDKGDESSEQPHDDFSEDSLSDHGDLPEPSPQDMECGVGSVDREQGAVVSPAVSADVVAGDGTFSPFDEDRQALAEHVRKILQNGIDGLTGNDYCKRPSRGSILTALGDCSWEQATAAAVDARSVAQSQNKAPNIAALFAQRLQSQVTKNSEAAA